MAVVGGRRNGLGPVWGILLTVLIGLAPLIGCRQQSVSESSSGQASPADNDSRKSPPPRPSQQLLQIKEPDAIAPIYEPRFTSGDSFPDNQMVLGIEIDGQAKAYPLAVLKRREIVNDRLAGQPILVSWCSLCGTGIVHRREVNGKEEQFGNQGALFINAMTLFDHSTHSIWSQVWGRAIEGPLAGTQLATLPSQIVPWRTWKQIHPEAQLLVNDLVSSSRSAAGPTLELGGIDDWGEPFHAQFVIGVVVGEEARAYAYPYAYRFLERTIVVNDTIGEQSIVVLGETGRHSLLAFSRTLDDKILTFECDGKLVHDQETSSVWDPLRGVAVAGPLQGRALQQISHVTAFFPAWRDFYPDSKIVQIDEIGQVGK